VLDLSVLLVFILQIQVKNFNTYPMSSSLVQGLLKANRLEQYHSLFKHQYKSYSQRAKVQIYLDLTNPSAIVPC
jgi:hypothetical protein